MAEWRSNHSRSEGKNAAIFFSGFESLHVGVPLVF